MYMYSLLEPQASRSINVHFHFHILLLGHRGPPLKHVVVHLGGHVGVVGGRLLLCHHLGGCEARLPQFRLVLMIRSENVNICRYQPFWSNSSSFLLLKMHWIFPWLMCNLVRAGEVV